MNRRSDAMPITKLGFTCFRLERYADGHRMVAVRRRGTTLRMGAFERSP